MTVLVTGARGAVARSLSGLLASTGTQVRVGSRAPDLSPGSVRCDLADPATFAAALEGVDGVFLYAEGAHIGEFLSLAARSGVQQIVLLSSSSVLEAGSDDDPLAAKHMQVERAVAAGPISSTILRPGAFARNALDWARSIAATGSVRLAYPNSHTAPIHEVDIAAAAHALLTGAAPDGGAHTLTGPESLSFADQLAMLAPVVGRPVEAVEISREQWKADMAAYIPANFADSLLDMWRATDGTPVEVTKDVEELTGRPARSFADWVQDNAAAFG